MDKNRYTSYFLRPEEKNLPSKRYELHTDYSIAVRSKRPWYRAIIYYSNTLKDTTLHEWAYMHSHRSNFWKPFVLAAFSFYVGTLLYYYNYKVNVMEPKWVQDYG